MNKLEREVVKRAVEWWEHMKTCTISSYCQETSRHARESQSKFIRPLVEAIEALEKERQ